MPRFSVLFLVDATVNIEVEADTPDEAVEKAADDAQAISVCHQCSDRINVNDTGSAIEVVDLDTGEATPIPASPEGE